MLSAATGWMGPAVHISFACLHLGVVWHLNIYVSHDQRHNFSHSPESSPGLADVRRITESMLVFVAC